MLRRCKAMDHNVQLVSTRLQGFSHPIDIGLLLHFAREISGSPQFRPQLFYRHFRAVILIGEQQLCAFPGKCARDCVRNAPFIPYAEDDCRLAFQ